MKPFKHFDADTGQEALALLASFEGRAKLMAGGTDLLGILKTEVLEEYPEALVNLKTVADLDTIDQHKERIGIGAMARLNTIATVPLIQERLPMLANAAASVGSPELRNMATIGGNLCQDTRCWYYRYPHRMGGRMPCYRKGKGPCHAVAGDNRYHAIFEGKKCYAVCPSDLAVALTALNGRLSIDGPNGSHMVEMSDFYDVLGPKLQPNEILTRIEISLPPKDNRQKFLKFRLRDAIDFAVVSVAVLLEMADDTCRQASIILGGVAPGPYRAVKAEEALQGKPIQQATVAAAAEAATAGAKPLSKNGYKVDLIRTLVNRALLG